MLALTVIAGLVATTQAPVTSPLDYGFRVHEVANLVCQLDILSGIAPGSKDAFEKLWKTKLDFAESDEKELEAWRKLWRRYGQQLRLPPPISKQADFPLRFEAVDISRKARLAGLDSDTLSDYRERINLLMRPNDAAEATRIVAHFQTRFKPWFDQEAKGALLGAKDNLEKKIAETDLAKLWSQVAAFWRAEIVHGEKVQFNLLYKPPLSFGSHAEQIENQAIIEVSGPQDGVSRLDVVSHELFHYFYSRSPIQSHFDQVHKLTAMTNGQAMEGLFNEAMATTFGNGLVARKLNPDRFERTKSRPKSFYNEDVIDRVGKALMPYADKWLAESKTIDSPGVLEEYAKACAEGLGRDLERPALSYRSLALVSDPQFAEFGPELRQALNCGSAMQWSQVDDAAAINVIGSYSRLPVMFLCRTGEKTALEAWDGVLGKGWSNPLTADPKSGVVTLKSPSGRLVVVFFAESPSQLPGLLKEFLEAKSFGKDARVVSGKW